jgi:hypothetical protein
VSFFQFVLDLRQYEVEDIADDGEISYVQTEETIEVLDNEPHPPGYTPDTRVKKLDFFFCSSCKTSFTSEDFLPVTPEKIAAALSGLLTLEEELE